MKVIVKNLYFVSKNRKLHINSYVKYVKLRIKKMKPEYNASEEDYLLLNEKMKEGHTCMFIGKIIKEIKSGYIVTDNFEMNKVFIENTYNIEIFSELRGDELELPLDKAIELFIKTREE